MPPPVSTRLVPIPKSGFDSQALRAMAEAINALLNMQGVGGCVVTVGQNNVLIRAGAASGGLHLRGEWSPTASPAYVTDDIVVISDGDTAGTYGCIKDNPPSDPPDTGNGFWITLSKGDTIGVWL